MEIGHNTKFRAIMFIPWILWAMFYLREKPGLLGLGFLASTLIVQLRENHPQISYYLYLFIGMYWIWQLVESIIKKDHKRFWLFTCCWRWLWHHGVGGDESLSQQSGI